MKKYIPFLAILGLMTAFGCIKDPQVVNYDYRVPELPETTYNYITDEVQNKFTGFFNIDMNNSNAAFSFDNNAFFVGSSIGPRLTAIEASQLSDDIATLGRVLFYDNQLSVNNTISCGTCHVQEKGFADDFKLTPGFKGDPTDRNTIAIANVISQDGFFWNNNVAMIEDQVLNPVQNHKEMGMEDLGLIANKLQATSYYPELMTKAFGDEKVTNERVSEALSQFMISMISSNSKMDKFVNHTSLGIPPAQGGLSPLELAGLELFSSKAFQCASCHKVAGTLSQDIIENGSSYEDGGSTTFVSQSLTEGPGSNIGLDLKNTDAGNGRNGFKIPSLTNVALTAPYMHDGRFATLEEVLDHYSDGIRDNPNLDSRLRDESGSPMKMNMTEYEKQALVAFLHALTDEEYIKDVRFSDPFGQ